jgi:hypothetical protein
MSFMNPSSFGAPSVFSRILDDEAVVECRGTSASDPTADKLPGDRRVCVPRVPVGRAWLVPRLEDR